MYSGYILSEDRFSFGFDSSSKKGASKLKFKTSLKADEILRNCNKNIWRLRELLNADQRGFSCDSFLRNGIELLIKNGIREGVIHSTYIVQYSRYSHIFLYSWSEFSVLLFK